MIHQPSRQQGESADLVRFDAPPPGHRSTRRLTAAAAMAAALGLVGCARAIPTTQSGPSTVSADGPYIVDEGGHALYLFEQDKKDESYCVGACASLWPPYETDGIPVAGKGVSQKMLATITRQDGGRQVTYAGVPLYYYAGDGGKPDKTSGEGIAQFGAEWYLASPIGGARRVRRSSGEVFVDDSEQPATRRR